MKDFKPLYLQNLDLNLAGTRVLRLQLNRHLRELDAIAPHHHEFDQILLYFIGRGIQEIDSRQIPIRTGTVVMAGAGLPHAFRETKGQRPLCLVIDLKLSGSNSGIRSLAGQLTQIQLSMLRQHLSNLMSCSKSDLASNQFRVAGLVLEILDVALKTVGWLPMSRTSFESPLLKRVRRAFLDPTNTGLKLHLIAAKIGYQPDYLNRVLKQQCGLTLGQIRDQELSARSGRLLKQNLSVAEVAERLGFSEQNYFARWFRRQRGMTPSQWRRLG
ncbi:MAG: AraC family transcriptional regulator [Methylacidiphilales bacterium]|nr:AraC family transcriptional regulator [Candidatus Methylacidiphilales bacterium]